MILKSLNLTSEEITKRKTLLVAVPQFGKDAEIMVTEMTIAGSIRLNNLQRKIVADETLDETGKTSLLTIASLMSVMVCPDTGNFLLREDQLEQFHTTVNRETLESLMVANWELNPLKPVETLKEKKATFKRRIYATGA